MEAVCPVLECGARLVSPRRRHHLKHILMAGDGLVAGWGTGTTRTSRFCVLLLLGK